MKIPYGYVSYNGTKWLDCHVDIYNSYQDRLAKQLEATGKNTEELLNASHKLFVMFSRGL